MKLVGKTSSLTFALLAVVSGLSILNYFFPGYSWLMLAVIGLAVFGLSLYRLEYGVLALVAELVVGSKGRLLEEGLASLRMVIFVAVMTAYLIKIIKARSLGNLPTFIKNNKTDLKVEHDYELTTIDDSWLKIIEENVRYIDNILRNPNRFIINEEEEILGVKTIIPKSTFIITEEVTHE